MNSPAVLEAIRGGLIVSVQPVAGSVLDSPETVALLSACAAANGAAGLRIEGPVRIAAVRGRVRLPAIGLLKHAYPGFEPYITASLDDVAAVLDAGAEIVAADATLRPRPDGATFAATVDAVHRRGALVMADCATEEEARAAARAGADILGTTLCGYTAQTQGTPLPAIDLVRRISTLGVFTICEGGIGSPSAAKAAFEAGADAVVVGTAITNLDHLVKSFVDATPRNERVGGMRAPGHVRPKSTRTPGTPGTIPTFEE